MAFDSNYHYEAEYHKHSFDKTKGGEMLHPSTWEVVEDAAFIDPDTFKPISRESGEVAN